MYFEIQEEYLNPLALRLPFVLCNFGGNLLQGETSRPEGFVYHHVLWVEKGSGIFTAEETPFILSEGEGLFCRREVPHSYRSHGDVFQTMWITFLCMEGALEYYHIPNWFRFQVTPHLRRFVREQEALCAGNSTIISRSAAGYTWLCEWLSQLTGPLATPASAARQYLENHFAEPLTLDEIAVHAGMDKFALCRAYKREYGMAVMEQLKKIRIAKAMQLLRYTQYPVGDIGGMCGYENPSYFGKLFREETGQSPREYRTMPPSYYG